MTKDDIEFFFNNADLLRNAPDPQREVQERMLLGFSGTCHGDLFTDNFYSLLGERTRLFETWGSEALTPIPLFSARVNEAAYSEFADPLCEIMDEAGDEIRFVVISRLVLYGPLPSGRLWGYGSVGAAVTDLLHCLFALPLQSSWVAVQTVQLR